LRPDDGASWAAPDAIITNRGTRVLPNLAFPTPSDFAHQTGVNGERSVAPQPKKADWREETLERIRALILEADPDMIEDRKWKKPSNGMAGIPVWSHHGIVCTGETYKDYVKMTFAKGAFVKDPRGLFNSSLEGNLRRAIDVREGDTLDEKALKTLIRAAVALNKPSARG
jgi:hypothetical protein